MYDLFISYHWRDREAVERVAHALRQRGANPFLDRWYLVPGRSWVEVLEKTLAECRALAVFLGPNGMGRWQQREKELGLDRQAKDTAFSVIPVLLAGADPALRFLQVNTWVDLRNGESPDAIEILARAARGEPPGHDAQSRLADARSGVCPYRGLQPFREEDEAFFCGRQSFTEKLVEAVEGRTFVAVVGASGSGKSSVVRAGLMPALRHRGGPHMPHRHVWDMVAMRPLEDPLHSLATCLLPLLEPEMSEVDRLREAAKLAHSFRNGEVKLRSVVGRALEKQPGTDRLLLTVDQWEELYTLCRDDAGRQHFVDQLLDASAGSRLSIVITLRGDFYGHAVSDRRLSDRLQGGIVNIGPMTREELHTAIVEPAKKVFLRFEEGLDARILNDVGEEPGNLPLLEFLLTELWDKRRGGELLHEAYDVIGGVRRAIADRAERTFAELPASEQETARWTLLQLVAPGEGALNSRRRARLDTLGAAERDVITKLAQERLLVTARDDAGRDIVEIGHEALIREWGRLRRWVNEDRKSLRVLRRLEDEGALWTKEGEPVDLLLQSRRKLAEAEELLKARPKAVRPHVRAYVEASLAAERARQETAKQAERERMEQQASIERERLERRRLEAEQQRAHANSARKIAEAETARQLVEARAAREEASYRVQEAEVAQRLVRRTRTATAVVFAFLVVSVVAAGIAGRMATKIKEEKQVAERHATVAKESAQVAERNLEIALKLAAGQVTKVSEHIDTSEISSRVARELLKITEETLATLKDTRSAPEVTKGQIQLLMSLSDAFVHLGATDEALKHARTAQTLVALLEEFYRQATLSFSNGFSCWRRPCRPGLSGYCAHGISSSTEGGRIRGCPAERWCGLAWQYLVHAQQSWRHPQGARLSASSSGGVPQVAGNHERAGEEMAERSELNNAILPLRSIASETAFASKGITKRRLIHISSLVTSINASPTVIRSMRRFKSTLRTAFRTSEAFIERWGSSTKP